MARLFPKDDNFEDSPYSEISAAETMLMLDDSFDIFHSVQWVSKKHVKKSNSMWKENDFLLLSKQYGMLVIEVKGGKIYAEDGVIHQVNALTGEDFSLTNNHPLKQANDGMQRYRKMIRQEIPDIGNRFPVECAAWFTDCEIGDQIDKFPMEYRNVKEAVLDATALEHPEKLIEAFNSYEMERRTDISDEEYKKIIDLIAADFELVVLPYRLHKELDYTFLKLTNEQLSLLDYISEQNEATIQGIAGTGKTIIAKEAARRFADQDRKVLFLCFNRYLITDLKRKYPNVNIDYYNIHSFISKLSDDDISTPEARVKALKKIPYSEFDYDDIVIDEAQDLENDEIEYFGKYIKEKEGHFLVFYDRNQLVMTDQLPKWIEDSYCRLVLTKNCRNTKEIATTAYNVIDAELNQKTKTVKGVTPELVFAEDGIEEALGQVIEDYKSEENAYDESEITIISLKTEQQSAIADVTEINGHHISNSMDENGILFTTARKYKGLENKVIIINDVDKSDFENDAKKRLFYVACSRATQRLSIIIDGSDENVNSIANAINIGGNLLPKGKIAIKTKAKIKTF